MVGNGYKDCMHWRGWDRSLRMIFGLIMCLFESKAMNLAEDRQGIDAPECVGPTISGYLFVLTLVLGCCVYFGK